MQSFCRVSGCRHNKTHVTLGHMCGICKQYGHGQIECRKSYCIQNLHSYFNECVSPSSRCTICLEAGDVDRSKTHTDVAHHCNKCKNRHSELNCSIQNFNYFKQYYDTCPELMYFNLERFMAYRHTHVYMSDWGLVVSIDIDQGTLFMFRTPSSTEYASADAWASDNKCMFIDSYDWNLNTELMNTYFKSTEKCISINVTQFIDYPSLDNDEDEDESEYESESEDEEVEIEEEIIRKFQCPLCKTTISSNKISTIYSMSDSCSICLDNKVNLFFQECGHACVCKECCEKLESI